MGVSQTVIAERLGVSLSTWHGYEKGRRSPNSEHARRISKTFGVPTDWIWFGHEAFLPLHLHEKLQAAASLPDKRIRRRA
jgi:transcriptional regulator with XRE-family HTH domain